MSASTKDTINRLISSHSDLAPILEESLEDNEGELLPHLVLADVMRWLAEYLGSEPETCRSILDWLEREYERGLEDVRGLITVSGVEMIPDPGQPGSALRDWLGPALRRLDPWTA